MNLYIALIHYPVYNKNGEVVCTSITNHDIHDISRTAKTFGVKGYYLVHPVEALRNLALTIMGHWQEGFGATYNLTRKEAFSITHAVETLEQALTAIEAAEGKKPRIVVTSAKKGGFSYPAFKKILEEDPSPYLILFGTGYGMIEELMNSADYSLEPIYGAGDYNHLPVRAAAAIILDRLVNGERESF